MGSESIERGPEEPGPFSYCEGCNYRSKIARRGDNIGLVFQARYPESRPRREIAGRTARRHRQPPRGGTTPRDTGWFVRERNSLEAFPFDYSNSISVTPDSGLRGVFQQLGRKRGLSSADECSVKGELLNGILVFYSLPCE